MQTHSWQFKAYGLPEDMLQWTSQTLPEPGPGQALVKIKAVGMNRSEFNYVQGRYMPAREFPSNLGQEAVGEVIAVGPPNPDQPAIIPLSPGTRVGLLPGRIDLCGMGSYRDIGLYDQQALAPIPEAYSDAEGAALWMAMLTMGGALELAGITPDTAAGKRILLTAASSGMGTFALKLARLWGATTIATSRNDDNLDVLNELADHVVICSDSATLSAGVMAACGGFDAALDPVGEAFYPGMLEAAAVGAHIVSYERITGGEPVVPITTLMLKDLNLQGYTIYRPYRIPGLLNWLIEVAMNNADALRPIIHSCHPLSKAVSALNDLGNASHLGKMILLNE